MKARVIHIITKLELGGAQQNTLYTVRNLDRSRFSAALISGDGGILNPEAQSIPDLDFIIIPELVREINPILDLKALWAMRKLLRQEVLKARPHPVVVHTHSSKAGILGRWAAFLAGVHIIIHSFHGFGFNDFQRLPVKWAYILAEWFTGRVTDYFIAVSKANLEVAVKLKFGPNERMRVIRSGVEVQNFFKQPIDKQAKRKELGLGPNGPIVTMIGCLKPQKSPLDFARVAALSLKEIPQAWFLECGDGELREALEKEIKSLGIEERFKILGWRRDVAEILWVSDVLALTSLWEGLPRVYPQAMAASLPIVGTRVDGGPEAVEDGVNGYLLAPHDVEGMARRIVELLKSPEAAQKMGKNGQNKIEEFDIRLMVPAQEKLYEELLER